MNDIHVVQHLTGTLETLTNLIDHHAGIIPAPRYVHVVIDAATPEDVATWARALFGTGTRTNDNGQVFAERWYGTLTALRIQADGDGTL